MTDRPYHGARTAPAAVLSACCALSFLCSSGCSLILGTANNNGGEGRDADPGDARPGQDGEAGQDARIDGTAPADAGRDASVDLETGPPFFVLASDDFEPTGSNDTGWIEGWSKSADSEDSISEQTGPQACQGNGYLSLTGSNVWIERPVNLNGREEVFLRMWVSVVSFGAADEAAIEVSSNGADYYPLRALDDGDADMTCELLEFDLSLYAMSGAFYIGFWTDISEAGRFLVDDVQVVIYPQ